MSDAKWIGRVPPEHVNSLDDHLSLGLQRNKIPLPYPRPKRSMSPPVVIISHVGTNDQLADIFTKPLDENRFCELQSELNIINSQNVS
jgi:hypothetical protein